MRKTTVRASDLMGANRTLVLNRQQAPGCNSTNSRSSLASVLPIRPVRDKKFVATTSPDAAHGAQILAETAHDLNNALNVVRLQLDLLALDLLALGCGSADAVWKRLRLIQPAVGHASDVTKQLMHAEVRKSGRRAANLPRPTALNPVVQRMVPILSAMLPHGVALHMRLTPDLADVAIDPVHIVRIVSNLVLNSCAALAQHAGSGEGQVTLETTNDTGSVVLRVRDTGPGMPASARTNPFRQYFTPKPRRESSGLGLVSVRRMVRRVGGLIQIDSAPGCGTEVSIRFPAAPPRGGRRSHKPAGLSRRKPTARAHEQSSGPSIEEVRTESRNQR